jgi:hypothetical protein
MGPPRNETAGATTNPNRLRGINPSIQGRGQNRHGVSNCHQPNNASDITLRRAHNVWYSSACVHAAQHTSCPQRLDSRESPPGGICKATVSLQLCCPLSTTVCDRPQQGRVPVPGRDQGATNPRAHGATTWPWVHARVWRRECGTQHRDSLPPRVTPSRSPVPPFSR